MGSYRYVYVCIDVCIFIYVIATIETITYPIRQGYTLTSLVACMYCIAHYDNATSIVACMYCIAHYDIMTTPF